MNPLGPRILGKLMITKMKLSASVAALALLLSGGFAATQAADIEPVEPGCTLSGSVMGGYMFGWQNSEFDLGEGDFDGKDVDWETPFAEGAGLVTCGGFNAQADFAYYGHSGKGDYDNDIPSFIDDGWIDQTNVHLGGALFYRDPQAWAAGLQASWISQNVENVFSDSTDIDIYRVGLFGEYYFNEIFTLGGSAAYYYADWPSNNIDFIDHDDGFELAVWARYYATPDFSLMLRGDGLLARAEDEDGDKADLNGFAITGEGEYLVWDQGLSLFAGARYADRKLDADDGPFEATIEHTQVYAGIKFYFGQQGTLVERQRTGTIDNTSVFNEKLPNFFGSGDIALPPVL